MIVPIEIETPSRPVSAHAVTTQAELSMDLYERDGAYVADVFLGRCDDRVLRVQADLGEVAVLGSAGTALMRLRFREPIDAGGVTALRGRDLLTITLPKHARLAGQGSSGLRGWMR